MSFSRLLTYSYLVAFNIKLLLYPAVLSYDWQTGSVPVVRSLFDIRNLATAALLFCVGRIVLHLVRHDFGFGCDEREPQTAVTKSAIEHTATAETSGEQFKQQTARTQGISSETTTTATTTTTTTTTTTESGQPLFLVAVALLCFPYIPASNLFVTVGFVVAERILYIPSMGFCLMLVEGFHRLLHHMQQRSPSSNGRRCVEWNRAQKLLLLMLVAWTAVAALRTVRRNAVWTSRESLFE